MPLSLVSSFHLDEDRLGPIVLASMLALAIIINFSVKIYDMLN
jgi:hypothetical protein